MIDLISEKYKDHNVRHRYNEIYQYITHCEETELQWLDVKIQQMHSIINEKVTVKITDNVQKGFNKLYDHTMLEIGRARELTVIKNEQWSDLNSLKEDYNDIKSELNGYKNLKEDYNDIKSELNESKSNIMTIVALIVSIVPLLATNINLVNQNIDLQMVLASNGILLLVIGVVFFLISFTILEDNKGLGIASIVFIALGITLTITSVYLSINCT